MSKEIIEEDDIFEFEVVSAKEDQEGYRLNSIFDNRKLQKIQNLNFDLKAPGEELLTCDAVDPKKQCFFLLLLFYYFIIIFYLELSKKIKNKK